ncbi:MAG: haloalkane dehalogenase [Burkholderiales bacterium]
MPMEYLRTPESRFENLAGFGYVPRYADSLVQGLRLHYVDEGPRESGAVFVCLHGQPTWSYLYRHMIPVFTEAGYRVVAPDLFGFGRSDKPTEENIYTFEFHRNTLVAFIEALDLKEICIVCQDWGGLLGLTLPMDMPERVTRLLIMNTTLGTGDTPLTKGFLDWRAWANAHPDMEVGKLLGRTCPHLSEEERAAYDAPFPDARYKAGVRRFPNLVPDRPGAPGAELSRRARDFLRTQWRGSSFMATGEKDPVLGVPVMEALQRDIRGCPAPMRVPEAGHFVQEWGARIAANALAHFFPY